MGSIIIIRHHLLVIILFLQFLLTLTFLSEAYNDQLNMNYKRAVYENLYKTNMQKIQRFRELLGIDEKIGYLEAINKNKFTSTPQFMLELYNTVTNPDGTSRMNNPYDAKIVRSFTEIPQTRGAGSYASIDHQLINFNLSSVNLNLDKKEYILEAELHLHLISSLNSNFKSVTDQADQDSAPLPPYDLLTLYQVVPDESFQDEIDKKHKFLDARYISVHDLGWQIFDVKEAVRSWLSGAENLGLLVKITTATTSINPPSIKFVRKTGNQPENDEESLQPILVLFNDFENDLHHGSKRIKNRDSYYSDDKKRKKEWLREQIAYKDNINWESRADRRVTRDSHPEKFQNHHLSTRPRKISEVIPNRKLTMTSMDIYQQIFFQDKLQEESQRSFQGTRQEHPDYHLFTRRRLGHHRRHRREMNQTDENKNSKKIILRQSPADDESLNEETLIPESSTTSSSKNSCTGVKRGSGGLRQEEPNVPCSKYNLKINFMDIGLFSIIAPKSYDAYQCRGHCGPPLSQDHRPTNHATIQSIMYEMNFTRASEGDEEVGLEVDMPSCVPIKLAPISVLYNDLDKDEIVLKSFPDMVVVSCGCR